MTPVVGRFPEELTLPEQHALAGQWIALELYSPKTLPLSKIAAIGVSAAECARQITARGGDPSRYEYRLLKPPY